MNETAGVTAQSGSRAMDYNSSVSINRVKYMDNFVYTNVRRFVVVRQKREFCYAWYALATPRITSALTVLQSNIHIQWQGNNQARGSSKRTCYRLQFGQRSYVTTQRGWHYQTSHPSRDGERRSRPRSSLTDLLRHHPPNSIQCEGERAWARA